MSKKYFSCSSVCVFFFLSHKHLFLGISLLSGQWPKPLTVLKFKDRDWGCLFPRLACCHRPRRCTVFNSWCPVLLCADLGQHRHVLYWLHADKGNVSDETLKKTDIQEKEQVLCRSRSKKSGDSWSTPNPSLFRIIFFILTKERNWVNHTSQNISVDSLHVLNLFSLHGCFRNCILTINSRGSASAANTWTHEQLTFRGQS